MNEPAAAQSQKLRPRLTPPESFWIVVFGVLLPILALGFECTLHMLGNAGSNLDPIPTLWHVAYIAVVPSSMLFITCCLANGWEVGPLKLQYLAGLAIGIAAIYSITFIPIVPMLLLGLVYGTLVFFIAYPLLLDLAGWSPFSSFIAGISRLALPIKPKP